MVSYVRFTRSSSSTARGQRALNRSTIALIPLLLRPRRESSATIDRNARAAGARRDALIRASVAAAAAAGAADAAQAIAERAALDAADQVPPPSPIRPVPMPNFDAEVREFDELQDRISRVLIERIPLSSGGVHFINMTHPEAAALLVPSPPGFEGVAPAAAPAAWGPRRRPVGRRIQLARAFENSPIRRPRFINAQRALPFSTWAERSPQQDFAPATPESSCYSPISPRLEPPTPGKEEKSAPCGDDDGYSTDEHDAYHRMIWESTIAAAAVAAAPVEPDEPAEPAPAQPIADEAAEVPAGPYVDITDGSISFPIDLTVEGTKENPIEL